MTTNLYTAPLGSGATNYLVHRAINAAKAHPGSVYVLVASAAQARVWKARLTAAGGALGVRVITFGAACDETLNAAGHPTSPLPDAAQFRFVSAAVTQTKLDYYAPLQQYPGFMQAAQHIISELRSADISPDTFADVVKVPRLAELGSIYATYTRLLDQGGWQDAGMLARKALDALDASPALLTDWHTLLIDGFDGFTQIVTGWIQRVASRVAHCEMVLPDPGRAQLPRFALTKTQIETALQASSRPLPKIHSTALAGLRHCISDADWARKANGIELIAAPDREGEVRAALRWLKQRHVQDEVPLERLALLARKMQPYRPMVLQVAAEMGILVVLIDGETLSLNPAVAALLELLRAMLPVQQASGQTEPALTPRLVLDAWRSPYFDWQGTGINPETALMLDTIARVGNVVQGQTHWQEAFDRAVSLGKTDEDDSPAAELEIAVIQHTQAAFTAFLERCLPPAGERNLRDWCIWLEDLIGPDPQASKAGDVPEQEETETHVGLAMLSCIDRAPEFAHRDRTALQQLKTVLGSILWADDVLSMQPDHDGKPCLTQYAFAEFLSDLQEAISGTAYEESPTDQMLLVADVLQVRGLSFDAVAILGLAESEFPATLSEDPFLRDDDREALASALGVKLTLSTEGSEREYFYIASTRATQRILFTRPRLADNGAPWQASPFWEDLCKVAPAPRVIGSNDLLAVEEAASLVELQMLVASGAGAALSSWFDANHPNVQAAIAAGATLASNRYEGVPTRHDGALGELATELALRYGADYTWSASQIETYRDCAHRYFVERLLRLTPRPAPAIGPDMAQLGTLYHALFQGVYKNASDPANPDCVTAALEQIAPEVFDSAKGFRNTPWWSGMQAMMLDQVRVSIRALADEEWTPAYFEQRFHSQVVTHETETARVRGVIDRIDIRVDGALRVIDYKLSGTTKFTSRALTEGKKLQLPLYALAARDELGLGDPVDGFYFHYTTAEKSPLQLADWEGGVDGAIQTATEHFLASTFQIRAGAFPPMPPSQGCPSYCPAAAYCWHYSPRSF